MTASNAHRHVIRSVCFNCKTRKAIPAPAIISDKDKQLKAASTQPTEARAEISTDMSIETPPSQLTLSRKQKKRLRQARSQDVFYKQPQHQLYVGDRELSIDER